MEPPVLSSSPRRRIWPWVLAVIGVCLMPFVILGVVVASVMTLNRDALLLRRHVIGASHVDWHTKVQLNVPSVALGALRTGLGFVHCADIEEAKSALRAINGASVGVYQLDEPARPTWSREQLFAETDKAMQKRGWTRMVGVVDHKDTVLVYVREDMNPDEPVDLCIAVVSGRELVVCSTSVNFDALAKFADDHMKDGLNGRLRFAHIIEPKQWVKRGHWTR